MRDHPTRRPMPVEQSILWKPLHDSHYVVASLQPAEGGRRKIFIRQRALGHAQAAAKAAHGRPVFGLLLGHLYECSTTGANYFVIESIAEQKALGDEGVTQAVERALTHSPDGLETKVLGWYRSAASVDPRPSKITAGIHATNSAEPWQTTLVLAEASNGGGAFLLRDTTNSRWFYAPFYELPDHAQADAAPKSTVVFWPQYMTAEPVNLIAIEPARMTTADSPAPTRSGFRPTLDRSIGVDRGMHAGPVAEIHSEPAQSPLVASEARGPSALESRSPERVEEPPTVTDKEVLAAPEPGLADLPPTPVERPAERPARRLGGFGDRPVRKLTSVDDHDQKRGARGGMRLVNDDDDTTRADQPGRYVDLARSDGFFVAGRFDTQDENGRAEMLWVMNEPYSGLLLILATTEDGVLDATLHYNLQTDEAGVLRTPFPEHRDPDSHTIYVRETCVDSLRAKCRRLRDTKALVRDWKVSPSIALLTPGEWQSIGVSSVGDPRDTVRALNDIRVAELPEGVRKQFGLTAPEQPG